ncbi:DUF551 domain-containing protein [Klebsiella pneumoniae]|uniref:DUF551 domain-containing protein n=1 Tax=Klebsiella pneumoniae TaxID=573 RepID=UPI002A20C802|nr:DUF551 domain-containing protein [Klebsiella pneumoniae]HBT4315752.1 DUF551 domain-containing protein [Klebsiella aerogenes]HBZ7239721.1 DUF551 domain-containing protein [Klebsiella pneumoniae]HBZ7847150.1 DUF551 domain-containing protein [Klebsiella pneumoniae]HCB0374660.1 DUF551 domain-containing protein [Klebsiella pneumoniae]
MKWIAVTENMPEPSGQFYLVIVNTEHGVGFSHYDRIDGFRGLTLSGGRQCLSFTVTHWMPLPKSPSE